MGETDGGHTPLTGRVLYRAELVGSLLRPRPLTQAFRLRNAGALGEADYREIQDRAIRNAVAMQEQLGFAVVTDGEFRRGASWSVLVDALDGIAMRPAPSYRFHDGHSDPTDFVAPAVTGPLARRTRIAPGEFAFLRRITDRAVKVTLPAPSVLHFWGGNGPYRSDAEFFAALTALYRDEIASLAALGCRYVQLDDEPLALLCDAAIRRRLAAAGRNPDRLAALYVGALNDALAARPADMTTALHLCRGNFKGKWLAEGSYEPIAERVFGEAAVDLFLLEYDSARAGDFAPLRFVPAGKAAVLGLVSTKTPEMESIDALCARVKAATRYVALDRLAVSPQCGFATSVSGNPLSLEHEKRKLALVIETARLMWG